MNARRAPVAVVLPAHGVYVWETQHDHGFVMEPESHPFAELFYALDGRGTFVLAGRGHACGPGDVVVVPPGVVHQIADRDAPLTLYGIGVSAELLACDPELQLNERAGVVPGSRVLAARVRAGLRQMFHEQTDTLPGGRAKMVGLALQLVALVARSAPRPAAGAPRRETGREAVERFRSDLDRRFYEPPRLDRAAAELGLSRRSFTRLFRAAAGCPFAEYVERVRVEYACRLLRDTARGITSIAFECGYEDLSAFYRAFKRHTGQSPGRWRGSGAAVPVLREVGPIRQSD
ncbi:HTH-type transcriptional activator RhaR [Gemmata obscuriglobus]|uniref:AraC family transcriptional regulator n=1 Tax=Gemmata obscuriglobus TaxID=114 RepID=A0A2Z3H4C2_9BACT|nr:AraC family transcriptional regulator [Gemmata obscuriglobus]AWM40853.1 AraC family transcriptional regulator [Gemmata obscuriglobus]QEG25857.1 HTH-type transcriptional activator RhaR [Gemmata obscuriglobus]VTR99849.1 transcriptional family : AraC family transcriptional regulator OS=Rhodopirellula sallentina SM41 GN=RSSM_06602 PE=4 SV=1: AraC_binding: HTH_18 [Gemmata obscuriglobus UQM 2246]